jgi:hypothetical protein
VRSGLDHHLISYRGHIISYHHIISHHTHVKRPAGGRREGDVGVWLVYLAEVGAGAEAYVDCGGVGWQAPEDMMCPITHTLMVDPVIAR